MAHITGGGLIENVKRVIPNNLSINLLDYPIPPLFQWIQNLGGVSDEEMQRVFNLGIGMVLIISPSEEQRAIELLNGKVIRVGEIS